MTLVMVLLTIAVVGGVSAVVAGVVSGGLSEPSAPIPVRALPARPLTGEDIAGLRFVQGFRGYRMDQVDAAMDQLAHEVERLRRLVPADLADQAAEQNGSLPPLPERPGSTFAPPEVAERSEAGGSEAGTSADAFDAVLAEPEAEPAGPGADGPASDGPARADGVASDDAATAVGAVDAPVGAGDAPVGERARLPSDLPTGRD